MTLEVGSMVYKYCLCVKDTKSWKWAGFLGGSTICVVDTHTLKICDTR